MGLFNETHKKYYQAGDHGNYQFTSLDNIISQFEIAYVGENKIIPKINRVDIAFHAQRALQELSFDTLKSCKSYQIDVPPSLKMILPHDYVNYTKVSWVDGAGIKHPLYYTHDTNNPFQIAQEDDGSYSFPLENEEVVDGDFAAGNFDAWMKSQGDPAGKVKSEISSGELQFSHGTRNGNGATNWGYTSVVYQELDVSDKQLVDLSATGLAKNHSGGAIGVLRVGLSTNIPDTNDMNFVSSTTGYTRTTNWDPSIFNLLDSGGEPSYLEWKVAADGTSSTTKESLGINVSTNPTVYLIVVSFNEFYTNTGSIQTIEETNKIDDISVTNNKASVSLSHVTNDGSVENSSTWNTYKSTTPSENNNDDYEDDTYWPIDGNRYGLDPQRAQINGSFYIDCRLGKIHFSSNISGKL